MTAGALPDLIVRADADARIGLGHLVRSLALAHAWRDAGGAVVLATTTASDEMPAGVAIEGMRVVQLEARHPDPADLTAVAELVAAARDPWLVVDGYHFDAAYTRALDQAGGRVLVIDDQADQPVYHADALLNQNPEADALPYAFDAEPLRLFGPSYALLPRAFARWRDRDPAIPAEPARLLITLGGARPGAVAAMIVRGCARFLARRPMRAIVLAGPGTSTAAWAEAAAAALSGRLEIVSDPPDVAALMASADMAVSASGGTAWQLCFMGVPTLLTTVADNQSGIARWLDEAGCAVDLGPGRELGEAELGDALERLFCDQRARDRLSRRARELVDGRGAERVLAALTGKEDQA
jgi:UDP-2,4-diacetamido-2,4,6-trideoxy-beta-L-altropyranose hydrolase